MKPPVRKIIALACAALVFGATVFAQKRIDASKADAGEQLLYLPNAQLLKHFTGGLTSIVADLLWLNCVQYTGRHVRTDREFTWLKQIVNTVVDLDPYFEGAYVNGAIFLTQLQQDTNAGYDLLKRGVENIPWSWELPQQLAMIHLIDRKEEYGSERMALHYLTMSAKTGRAPAHIADLAAKLQGDFDLDEIEEEMWMEIAESGDKLMRDLAQRKLQLLENRRACGVLNQAIAAFEQGAGRKPASLEELVRPGMLPSLPEDPLGGRFFIDADGAAQNSSILDEEKKQRQLLIEGAVSVYHERNDETWPPDLESLIEAKLLAKIPEHPYAGETWKYDPETGAVE